jgi:hypothetical protein
VDGAAAAAEGDAGVDEEAADGAGEGQGEEGEGVLADRALHKRHRDVLRRKQARARLRRQLQSL